MEHFVAAEKLGLPTSPPYFSLVDDSNNNNNVSFLNGVSFASGGARILDGTDPYVVRESKTFHYLMLCFVSLRLLFCLILFSFSVPFFFCIEAKFLGMKLT